MLEAVTRWVIALHYPGIVALTALENLFPPLPTEPVISLAGFAAARGEMTVLGLILAGTLGSTVGSLPLYYWGKKIGEERCLAWCETKGGKWGVPPERMTAALNWFRRYGGWAIVLGRLAPGLRSLISIPAGMCEIDLSRFLIYTTIGSALRMAQLTFLGVIISESLSFLTRYGIWAGVACLFALAVGLLCWKRMNHLLKRWSFFSG